MLSGYLLRGTSPPNLPFSKGRNVLSFSFTTIEFSLDKAFKWLCSTPLPLKRGEREGITYTELTYFISFWVVMQPTSPLGKVRKRGDC